jgi:hypothetical protein
MAEEAKKTEITVEVSTLKACNLQVSSFATPEDI